MNKKKTGAEMIFDMFKKYMDEAAEVYEAKKEKEQGEGYYDYPECEDVDGDCTRCLYWNSNEDYCELDEEGEEEEEIDDCWNDDDDWGELDDHCRGLKEKENQQLEDLSKLVKSIGTVLDGDMGILVFDKSNRKDMEKLSRIFADYAKRLYQI